MYRNSGGRHIWLLAFERDIQYRQTLKIGRKNIHVRHLYNLSGPPGVVYSMDGGTGASISMF